MTPVWIFPAYPLLVVGPHAAVLASRLNGADALRIIIGGTIFQGIGFMVSLMIYAAFIYRLMTQKLPQESLRPGMFISVGPSGFTIAGIVGMGHEVPRVVDPSFMGDGVLAGRVSMILANWVGIWLWGLALWFFLVSVFSHWSTLRHNRWQFAMTWYSYVFPNTALITATFSVGRALNSRGINIFGCVMTCLLIPLWFVVFGCMIHAVWAKDILWPQKQEDRDEGGFTSKSEARLEHEGGGSGAGSERESPRGSVIGHEASRDEEAALGVV
jgi:tellurite resistance protein TehA-like permease